MAELKHLMKWDERLDNPVYGPPGSIRTGPPEVMSALPADTTERVPVIADFLTV
jgi:paired amphipathic helix protein Sin3a